ncbi:MAG: hypothetical protein AAFQ65_03595 [Myxococcota bacterium]
MSNSSYSESSMRSRLSTYAVLALTALAAAIGLGVITLFVTALTFASPTRQADPNVVMAWQIGGLAVAVLATWVGSGVVLVRTSRRRFILQIVGGGLGVVGFCSYATGVIIALSFC